MSHARKRPDEARKTKASQNSVNRIRKDGNSMPLAMVPEGETRIITEFRGQEEMKRHLQDLGFTKGEKVRVAGESPSGMILVVKGVKIALNRGLANRIMVNG